MIVPEIVTLGCRLNRVESEIIHNHIVALDNNRPVVIINTCAVTCEAERQARQTIRRVRREKPNARIVVTGCAAQLHPENFSAMPEVDQVLGNREKLDLAVYHEGTDKIIVSDIMTEAPIPFHPLTTFRNRTRAFVQIQQGCDHRCTFCVVPFTRGPSCDVAPTNVITQVRQLVKNGYREVTLTGVDIASYKEGLGMLVATLLKEIPDLQRLRLSTLDPAVFDPNLLRLMSEEERLMPYLHLSLQSGSDMVLKRMRRRHQVSDVISFVQSYRRCRPDLVFGADLIAGFPTETDEMAVHTEEIIREINLVYLHVFPYSPRPGTPAAYMPQVPESKRKIRAARLRDIGAKALSRHLMQRQGSVDEVLIEENHKARCRDFTPVNITHGTSGDLCAVHLDRLDGETLIAEPL